MQVERPERSRIRTLANAMYFTRAREHFNPVSILRGGVSNGLRAAEERL